MSEKFNRVELEENATDLVSGGNITFSSNRYGQYLWSKDNPKAVYSFDYDNMQKITGLLFKEYSGKSDEEILYLLQYEDKLISPV